MKCESGVKAEVLRRECGRACGREVEKRRELDGSGIRGERDYGDEREFIM